MAEPVDGQHPARPEGRSRRPRRVVRPATRLTAPAALTVLPATPLPAVSAPPGQPGPPGAGPEQTRDDTDVGWGQLPDQDGTRAEQERWLLAQRPPHWD